MASLKHFDIKVYCKCVKYFDIECICQYSDRKLKAMLGKAGYHHITAHIERGVSVEQIFSRCVVCVEQDLTLGQQNASISVESSTDVECSFLEK